MHTPHLKVNLTVGTFIELNNNTDTPNMKIATCYRVLKIAHKISNIPQYERININNNSIYLQLEIYLKVNCEVKNDYSILGSTAERVNKVYQTRSFI